VEEPNNINSVCSLLALRRFEQNQCLTVKIHLFQPSHHLDSIARLVVIYSLHVISKHHDELPLKKYYIL
jgi:hypothetical protein